MRATERHREAEERFRELLVEAELPAPDQVAYEPESVVFYWHEPKVAVFVDFEDDLVRRARRRGGRPAPDPATRGRR